MRLTDDKDASFISFEMSENGCRLHHMPSADGAQGIMFTCPLPDCGHTVIAWFKNPVNAEVAPPEALPSPRWGRAGMTLADITLRPSINILSGCKWHGFVTNGEAE